MVDISIVIVNWNARAVLLDTLQSIRESPDCVHCEVIVVDNASGDGSAEQVAALYPEVRLIRSATNLGFAAGNNLGMRASQGRYIFLVNSDVIVLPGALDALVGFLDAHPDTGVAGPRVLNTDHSLQFSCRNAPSPWRLVNRTFALDRLFARWGRFQGEEILNWSPNADCEVEAISGCFMAVRREALEQVGLFDETFFMYAEDIDWCCRFRKAGWRIQFVSASAIIHLGGASSANAPARFHVERQRAVLQYWNKHYGWPGALFCAVMLFIQSLVRLVPCLLFYVCHPSRRSLLQGKLQGHLRCLLWLGLSREPWRIFRKFRSSAEVLR